ncbi:MAG: SpoIIE family protein phosphatase [Clostridia bacterium]
MGEHFSNKDLLDVAVSIEEDGVEFYTKLYQYVKNDREKQEIFSTLAQEEKNHSAFFKRLYRERLQESSAGGIDTIFDGDVAEAVRHLEEHYKVSEEDLLSIEKQSFQQIINYAVEQEYKTITFYSALLKNMPDDKIKESLYKIIHEEEQHVIKLKEMIYYNKISVSKEEHIYFIEDILNSMQDWVRVIDLDDNIIYVNEAIKAELGYHIIGRKCFEIIGRTSPCDGCISKRAASLLKPIQKEEVINGKIFSVMSSPLKNLNGEVQAVIEVLRDITQARLMENQIKAQNKRFNEDLNIARKLQGSLLPKPLNMDKVSFTYAYKPCEAIGGDFFDIFQIDQTHVGAYIADVSGHGVPASMLTMFLRQTIHKHELSPAKVLKHLYLNYGAGDFGTELYITMFYAVIDIQNKKIRYANAGHNMPPILFNLENQYQLNASGFPISNWVEEVGYQEFETGFSDGDRMLLLTDGIADICNPSGQRYGVQFIEESLANNACKGIEEMKNIIIQDTYNFASGEELESKEICDDITLVLLEFK